MTNEITLKIQIDKPAEELVAALIQPSQLTRWLAREATLVGESPLRITLGWPHHSFEIRYRECCSERIEIDWGSEKGVGRELCFILSEHDGSTLVTLMHRGFEDSRQGEEMLRGHIEGWTFYLCNLKTVLECDCDLRRNQPRGSLAY